MYNVHREWHWLLARKSDVSKTSHLLKPSLWGVKLCKSIAMNIMWSWDAKTARVIYSTLDHNSCIGHLEIFWTPGLALVGHVFVKYQIWMQCPELFRNYTVDARHSQQLHRVYLGYFNLWAVSVEYKRLKCTKYRREVFTKWPQQLHRALGYFESLPAHQGRIAVKY